jgi:hypothetical protein
MIKSSYFSTLAIRFVFLTSSLAKFVLRKVDWDACDVAHVILENVQRDIGDRLDDFTVTQTDGTGAREVRVREFTTLNYDAAREFEDGIGSRVGRARANRIVDFGLIQSDFRGHCRVRA